MVFHQSSNFSCSVHFLFSKNGPSTAFMSTVLLMLLIQFIKSTKRKLGTLCQTDCSLLSLFIEFLHVTIWNQDADDFIQVKEEVAAQIAESKLMLRDFTRPPQKTSWWRVRKFSF